MRRLLTVFLLAGCSAAPGLDAGADAGLGDVGPRADVAPTLDAGSDAGPPPPEPIPAAVAATLMTPGFNVGNTFDVDQHPRTLASVGAMIDAYADRGFRMVRLPVRWLGSDWDGEPALADATGAVDGAHPRLAALEAIVDHALARDVWVVLNTHHEDWLFEAPWSDAQLAIFERLWSDVCAIFADRGYRLVFELVNEPHGTIESDRAAVSALNQTAYDVIRSCGGRNAERIVILDGQNWGSPASLRATWPEVTSIPGGGDDPWVMGSIHYYAPLELTHATNAAGIDTPWTVDAIRTSFDGVAAWADGRLPIYVGEMGVNWDQHAHAINDNVRGWYRTVATEARARSWPVAVWDDGGWYRVMDRDDQTFDGLETELLP
jgi:endoglucanase